MNNQKQIIANNKDWVIIGLYLAICVIGLLCIFSVEYRGEADVLKSFIAFKKNYSKQFIYCAKFCSIVFFQ